MGKLEDIIFKPEVEQVRYLLTYYQSLMFISDNSAVSDVEQVLNSVVIKALEERLHRLENPPLTFEQIAERIGKPVWIVTDDGAGWEIIEDVGESEIKFQALEELIEDFTDDEIDKMNLSELDSDWIDISGYINFAEDDNWAAYDYEKTDSDNSSETHGARQL